MGQGQQWSCACPSVPTTSPQLCGRCHSPVAGQRLRAAAVARVPWLPGGQLRGDARAHGGPGHGEQDTRVGGLVGNGGQDGRGDTGCAVPRVRTSPGSSSSSPTGVSRSGRRSARSQPGEWWPPPCRALLSKTRSAPPGEPCHPRRDIVRLSQLPLPRLPLPGERGQPGGHHDRAGQPDPGPQRGELRTIAGTGGATPGPPARP